MVKRVLLFLFVLLVAAAGYAAWRLYEPDIRREALIAKYAALPSEFIDVAPGVRAHYRDRGPRNAPVILLLHGSNASLFDFEPWSKTLSLQFRVVSVDLPGHGLTGAVPSGDYSQGAMAAFVKAFVDKLGLADFALAGNSMGGGVAARFAELYPDRVTHLVLIDAYADGLSDIGDREPLAFRLAQVPRLNQLLLYVTPRAMVVEGLNDAVVHKAVVTDAMINAYWDFARMTGSRAATVARFTLPRDFYVRDHIGTIRAPTLILWGEEDHVLPVAGAHAWAKAIPGAKLIAYPAVGHLPMEEVPEESASDVRTFITRAH
jgi:pimeloyl-ACP methyl ester carboxylesterase